MIRIDRPPGAGLRLATSLVLLAIAVQSLPAQQSGGGRFRGKVLLRHHPTIGTQYHQFQEEEVHMRADSGSTMELPEQRFRSSTYSLHEVTGQVAAGVSIAMRIDSAFAEAVLPTGETRREEMVDVYGMKGDLIYDDRMRLVHAVFLDAVGRQSDATRSLARNVQAFEVCAFPTRAVSVGDSWEETVAMPVELPGMNQPVTGRIRMTLRDVRLVSGDTTAVIGLGFRTPNDPIAVTEGEERFTMRLKGEWTGELQYSLTRGATLAMDLGGSIRIEIASPEPVNQSYAMRMDQRLVQRLVESSGGGP